MWVENAFNGKRYPPAGEAPAVLDTGYEGFLGLPEAVFEELGLSLPQPMERTLVAADGRKLPTRGTFARLGLRASKPFLEGMVETWPGLDEVLVGAQALSSFCVELDYCIRRISMSRCRRVTRP